MLSLTATEAACEAVMNTFLAGESCKKNVQVL